jgi:hypothetical protein
MTSYPQAGSVARNATTPRPLRRGRRAAEPLVYEPAIQGNAAAERGTPSCGSQSPETATITGKMFAKRKQIRTPGQGSDPAARQRLCDETEKLTHLT